MFRTRFLAVKRWRTSETRAQPRSVAGAPCRLYRGALRYEQVFDLRTGVWWRFGRERPPEHV